MKTFLRLLKNFIILSLPLVFISVYTLINPMGYMSIEYPMWAEERDMVRDPVSSGDPETLIAGDSRAKSGIMPGVLADDGSVYNIAIGGATSVEMYYSMNNYLMNHRAPENVILIFAPYHFCEMDNWKQTLYYNYLTLPEVVDTEVNALKYAEESVIYNGFLTDLLSFKLRLPNKYMDALYSARITGNRGSNREKYEKVRNAYGYTAFGEEEYNDGVNYETHHPGFDLSPMVDAYYIKLLDLLEKKGINVIIEQAPINRASDEVISDDFRSGFDDYMKAIEERYPGVTVERKIPVYDNSFFGDNNHMNRRGAERFSEEIKKKYDIMFSAP